MTFTELRFVLFFAIVFSVHWALRSNRWRKLFLLVASYVFYGAWDWRFLLLIALSTVVDYAIGRRLAVTEAAGARRALLTSSLALNLGLLATFKYFNFFVESASNLLTWIGLETSPYSLNVILPVGISFYTFQTLSYTIDVYRRQLEPTDSFLDFAVFVGFFPQLVAGPIVRARDFLPQLKERAVFDRVDVRAAATLFLFGFIKKACIADNVAIYVDQAFENPELFRPSMLWLGSVLYFIQIYCDFSGYSDMAIATAALLGYSLPLNFNFPIFARSITQFWRRWHMSLSGWFRDYLYIPLGGNQKGAFATYRNLWLVFFLCALWHGAAWTFVVWGMVHGFVLVIERAGGMPARLEASPIGYVWTFLIANFAWVFFRATSIEGGWHYLKGMFAVGSGSDLLTNWDYGLAIGVAFLGFHALNYFARVDYRLEKLPKPAYAIFIGAAFALALPAVATTYKPFIYFQF